MKLILILMLSTSLVYSADLVDLQTTSGSDIFWTRNDLYPSLAVHEDTIVTSGFNGADSSWLVFRKLNGQYVKVAEGRPSDPYTYTALNNGKWMGGYSLNNNVTLFQLDADDKPVNQTQFPIMSTVVALLSDNTVVYFNSTSSSWASLLFDESTSTWSEGPGIYVGYTITNYPSTRYWIDDNYIMFFNDSYWTYIYTRQSDGSWKETDGFAVDSSLTSNNVGNVFLYFNGNDTVIFAFLTVNSTPKDLLVFYTKVNNAWQAPQYISTDKIGFSDYAYLGLRVFAAVDQNNLIFGAPFEGQPIVKKRGGPGSATTPIGKALLVHRQRNNTWVPVAQVSSPRIGYFATGAVVTNEDIVLPLVTVDSTYTVQFYTVPLCVTKPMNVTCTNQQVSSCDINIDVSNTNAFSMDECNNLAVQTSIKNMSLGDNSLTVTFEFTRALSPSVTCTSTLTCPSPPTTTPTTPTAKSVSSASIASIVSASMLLGFILVLLP